VENDIHNTHAKYTKTSADIMNRNTDSASVRLDLTRSKSAEQEPLPSCQLSKKAEHLQLKFSATVCLVVNKCTVYVTHTEALQVKLEPT